MTRRVLTVIASGALVAASILVPVPALAAGQLGPPSATAIGAFGGIPYVEYNGLFEGQTSTGAYRVPYRITAPAKPSHGNRTVFVEPPHFAGGLNTLNFHFGRDFLLARGFAHGGVGWSTASGGPGADQRILDPAVDGTFIDGGFDEAGGRTDDEIVADFGRALESDPRAIGMLGRVERRYVTGVSDSSDPVLRLVASGHAGGVFELAVAITAEGHDPQAALADGLFGGKVIIVNSEADVAGDLVDGGDFPHQYRFYVVAGTPHVPDNLVPFFSNETTAASFRAALRAHVLQGHRWVRSSKRPPASTQLLEAPGGEVARDASGNAIVVDGSGQPVPRLPFVELGEAEFITGFLGTYENVRTIGELGFASHRDYVKAFRGALGAQVKAGYMLREDADAMLERAALCPPLTFTETYRDHYQAFTDMTPCGE